MNLSVVITALSTMSEQLSHNIKARALNTTERLSLV